jgi:ferredoxin
MLSVTMPSPATIWIEEGCIQCGWCENLEPVVFQITARGCEIRTSARRDGGSGPNRAERSTLRPDALDGPATTFLRFIADGCPVQVIRFTGISDDALVG